MAGPTAFHLHIVVAFPDPLSSASRCLFPSSSFSSYQSLLLSGILASIVRRYCSIFTPLHHHLRLLLAPTTAAKPAPSGTYIVITNYVLSVSVSVLSLHNCCKRCAFFARLLNTYCVFLSWKVFPRCNVWFWESHASDCYRPWALSFFLFLPPALFHARTL